MRMSSRRFTTMRAVSRSVMQANMAPCDSYLNDTRMRAR
jgi:hypothetical protein